MSVGCAALVNREVHHTANILCEGMIAHVLHYTHNGKGLALNFDPPSNGGFARPRGPGYDFIDDEYVPAAVAILLVEIAALNAARAHDGEVARSDRPKVTRRGGGLLLGGSLQPVGAVPVRQ